MGAAPPSINWTPAAAASKANHSAHSLLVLTHGPVTPKMLGEIEFRLKSFLDFGAGANHFATVRIRLIGGQSYAEFNIRGVAGIPSRLVNGNPVPVRLCWVTDEAIGDTAGLHMLVGQRRWSVSKVGDKAIVIITEAYEWPRGFRNWLGMGFFGKRKQLAVWSAYLDNINATLANKFGRRGVVLASPIQIVPTNPWRPITPNPPGTNCP